MMYKVLYKILSPSIFKMPITAADIVSLSQARAHLSELAEQVVGGSEKIITKNGESYVALVDAARLDHYHRLERERVHLLILDQAEAGLADAAAGRVKDAKAVLGAWRKRRSASTSGGR